MKATSSCRNILGFSTTEQQHGTVPRRTIGAIFRPELAVQRIALPQGNRTGAVAHIGGEERRCGSSGQERESGCDSEARGHEALADRIQSEIPDDMVLALVFHENSGIRDIGEGINGHMDGTNRLEDAVKGRQHDVEVVNQLQNTGAENQVDRISRDGQLFNPACAEIDEAATPGPAKGAVRLMEHSGIGVHSDNVMRSPGQLEGEDAISAAKIKSHGVPGDIDTIQKLPVFVEPGGTVDNPHPGRQAETVAEALERKHHNKRRPAIQALVPCDEPSASTGLRDSFPAARSLGKCDPGGDFTARSRRVSATRWPHLPSRVPPNISFMKRRRPSLPTMGLRSPSSIIRAMSSLDWASILPPLCATGQK